MAFEEVVEWRRLRRSPQELAVVAGVVGLLVLVPRLVFEFFGK